MTKAERQEMLKNRLRKDLSRKGMLRNGFIKEKYGKSKQIRYLHGRPKQTARSS